MAVESTSSQAFEMSGTEILYVQNNVQVGVVGGWSLSGQTKIENQSTGQTVQPVKITSPGDPLAYLPAPTTGTVVGKTPTDYDMNNKPPNNTISPGVYCGGLTIGNTNGVTFTMSPGTYIMAGGGFTVNSLGVVSGSGVTVYNTSSSNSNMWGCAKTYSYTPITISGQSNVTLSGPTSGALANVVMFGDRAGCSTAGSCQDQINGGASTYFTGALYFKTDNLLISGNNSSKGCMTAVADTITFNGNSSVMNACTGTIGGVTVSVTPTTATLYGGQTQQFSATVTNTSNTAVTWTISPAGTGTINSSGLYTAPATISTQQTVTITATSQANTSASASATVTLTPKTTPTITWPAPAAITYGTALSATQLDATASVAGTFVYNPAAGTVPAPGNQTLSVTFTPTNTTQYNTATASVSLTVNKATPTITWPAPAAITYGTALSATQLDATANVAGTFVYTPAAGTVLAGGTQTLSVTFTPTNTTDYNTATATVSLTVNDATPVITWPAPAAITYGTALSVTQLDATASVAGTFVYTPASGTVLAAGTQTLSVTFTPTNTADYTTATATVSLTVNKATPTITWPAPAAITYGTALNATQLDATASVAGTFVYTPAAGTILAAGTQTLSVTFTPSNTTDYTTATASVSLTVNAVTPVITWPAPAAITYGTALSATQLDATASVAGTFVYTPASGTVLAAGTQMLSVTFTPTNTTDYTTATATVSLTVNKATPTITWPAPAAITYGTVLSATQLNATASVAGTYVYSPASGTVLAVGTQTLSVTFTPSNTTDYTTATATVSLTVQAAVLPMISASASPAPNSNGWNNSTVTVTFTCTAGSYPIATCPSPVAVTTQAANQQICGQAVDTMGNSSTKACATVSLDETAPTITAIVTPTPIGGINYGSATVTFTCSDSLSGVATCPAPVTDSTIGSEQVSGTATDKAGNSASASVTLDIQATAPPTISASASPAPNSNGWNNSTVTVTFTCTAGSYPIASCPSPVQVTTQGASQQVCGHAVDTDGNSSSQACASVSLDETAPSITATVTPTPVGGIIYGSATVTFTCTDALSGIATCPSPVTDSTVGTNSVSGTATDKAGNSASTSVTLNIQAVVPPTITAATTPAPNSAGWNTTVATVTFTCTAGTYAIQSCPSPVTVATPGASQQICGHAVDTQGNQSAQVCDTVNLELTPPTIVATPSPTANSAGWNNSSVTVSFACTPSVSPITSCSPQQTVTSQGAGQVITGTVQDQAGNQNTTSVTLNIDLSPPTIVQFTAPNQLSPGGSGTASVTVTDIAPIASVVFTLNGSPVGTALTAPYSITVTAPSNAVSGSTLTLTAVVTDAAGNTATANVGIQVASAGVVVGQVISDSTGLPLQGANVQVVGQASQTATSDSTGRYSIPVTGSQLFLDVSMAAEGSTPAMVTVERQISIQSGVGNVPVDARMTPQAAATSITASGGTVGTGAITLTVPAGGATTSYYLTPLSQQGLPGLLPLGWSPIAAFDLQTNVSTSLALSANFTGLPTGTLYLVSYSYSIHGWNMVTLNLAASNGSLTVTLPSTGDYALAIPDQGTTIPAVGQPLTGVSMVALAATSTSSGSLSPGNVGPGGGTSMATLAVQSQSSLPSGTAIQAEVTETYTLTSGQQLSEEPRYEDLLIYQNPVPANSAAGGATFPVTPSQTFQATQLTSGDVHLNILAGRESVRGEAGGSDPVSVQSGGATLTVAGGSLPQDTAINVSSENIDTFLPSTGTLVPLSEYNVDFSGQTLNSAAQLSVAAQGVAPGTNVVIVQIDRIAGVPYLVAVSGAQVTATNIVSQATPGLSGITQGGDYVFYEVTVPTGFVSGTVSAGSGPIAAMVQTDALPFVTFASVSGNYEIIAAAGTVNLTASVPNTALTGTGTAQVTAGQTATANLTVVGQVETATVTPANGAVGVPLTAEIDVVAADALNPATVTTSDVLLTVAGNTTPVPIRFVYSNGNTKLAVFPQNALLASTQYTFQASSLANALGGLITVPTISFTTAAISAPTYNTSALVFGMPDQNGNVSITAPAGSFPAGTSIQIVDETSGIVLTLTALNDGSVSGSIPGTINDTLQVTLTDSSGNQLTYTISQFVSSTGTTAIGPGGGTVVGPGNTGIIVPAGALPQGTTFQITQLDQTSFPVLPTWTGANFGSGMRITDPAMPTFKAEAKLAFPVPANAPSNAFYYVFRRLTDQSGNIYFETIDEAFVQGTGASAQVVTASPPFCGYHNSYGNFSIQSGGAPLPVTASDQDYFVMWDATAQSGASGIASQGLIVGLATQTVPAVLGVSEATTQPAQGLVTIFLTPPQGSSAGTPSNVAIYDGNCATFSLFDPQLGGGTRNVTATQVISTPTGNATNTLQATVDEVDGAQSDDGLYSIYAGLEDLYKNIGRVDFLFPAPTPPPPPPAVTVYLYTLNPVGHRVPTNGILQTGAQVVIAFHSNLQIQSATIDDAPLDLQTPDSTDDETTDNLPEQFLQTARVPGLYTLGPPGNYTLSVTAVDPVSQETAVANTNLLVVASGNTNTNTFVCSAAQPPADPTTGCVLPQVINIYPANSATSVDIGTFPEISFNEPVTNIPGNIVMASPSGAVPVILVGARAPSDPNYSKNPIADPVGPTDQVTSVTIQPTNGLNYNTVYTITLNANAPGGCLDSQNNPQPQPAGSAFILDLNQPPAGPFCLAPYPGSGQSYSFTTFAPGLLGGANGQYPVLTRPVVLNQTAYVGEYLSSVISGLGMFNVSNPVAPTYIPQVGGSFIGRVIDIAGQAKSPVTASGGGLVALAAGTALDNDIPGNVWLYDVSSPTQPTRVGAVSVTSDADAGIPTRLFMKDSFLYVNTFQVGFQVVDLAAALNEYETNFYDDPTDFGEAVTTAGDGFAMDTVTNTIPLPLLTGTPPKPQGSVVMLDLKADDIAATGGGASTLIVATGQLPFVMADPTLSGSSAIVYPPSTNGGFSLNPVQPLSMTSGTTNYLLCYGQALDIGDVPINNDNGTTSNQQIAVVVGNGIIGPGTSCPTTGQQPVLAVVSFNNLYVPGSPYTPQLTGMIYLQSAGTDVTLNGTTALVSTGSNVLMVSVANPSQPSVSGTIVGNFGNWLGLTSSGFIIGSTSGGSGVQTASQKPVVSATCPSPILTSVYSGAGTANPVYQPVQAITGCTVMVSPGTTPAANVNVTFTQTNPPISFTNVPLNNGVGQLPPIPQNTLITGSILNATASATNPQTGLPITGTTTPLAVGPVHLVVDSNNDTTLDPVADPQAAASGKAFNFWLYDADGYELNGGQDALLDFAQLRVYVNAPPPPGGKIQLTLSSATTTNTAIWTLTENAGVPPGASDTFAANSEKLYLQDSASSNAMASTGGITATNQIKVTNLPPVTCGAATGNSFTTQLCQSSAGSIELPGLQQGMMYDLIFSIHDTCFIENASNCLTDTLWNLQAQLVMNGQTTVLDTVPIDIRPIQQRMTAYSARGGNGAIQPASTATLVTGNTNIPAAVPWMDIPSGATKINVLVHGYDVSLANATQSSPTDAGFFPAYFKRLYWTGMPMMMVQNNTQTVGFAWYGDVNKYNWPDDEFSALLSGVPLANFLTTQQQAGRSIRIIAHSLGNMVVNSAINRLIVDGPAATLGAIKAYVMNEAAVPSEAFDAITASGPSAPLVSNAEADDGYPNDQTWQSEYQSFTSSETQEWNNTLGALYYVTRPLPQYGLRWTQQRPSGGVPDSAAVNSTPARGSWLGYFANNPNHVTIYNMVNDYDFVLGTVWWAAEYCEKPNITPSSTAFGSFGNCFPNFTLMTGLACASIFGAEEVDPEDVADCLYGITPGQVDDADKQYWAALTNTTSQNEATWGSPVTCTGANCPHANIERQFQELSYWFPSISFAEGAGGVPVAIFPVVGLSPPVTNSVTTIDFSSYSPQYSITSDPTGVPTHSYMADQPYSIVSPAWTKVRDSWCPLFPTCN